MGRRIPTEKDANPPLYRMSIFASDPISAKSRFWYFMKKLKKLKKTVGEICYCGVVSVCVCVKCACQIKVVCTTLPVVVFISVDHIQNSRAYSKQPAMSSLHSGRRNLLCWA